MPVVRLLYQSHGSCGAWDASSRVATLPACHVADENRQKVWRSTGAATSDWLRVNVCSTGLNVDRVAFVSANFTSCAAITIEADCTSCLSSASVFTTCFAPWAACAAHVTFADLSARQTGKRWWRFIVCDTGNDDGYYEVGVLALGPATCMRVEAQSLSYRLEDPSLIEYAPAGTPKTVRRDPYAVIGLPHRFLAESLVFDAFQDVLRDGGMKTDMILSLYSSAPACTCAAVATNLYGRLTPLPQFDYSLPGLYDGHLEFRESL